MPVNGEMRMFRLKMNGDLRKIKIRNLNLSHELYVTLINFINMRKDSLKH